MTDVTEDRGQAGAELSAADEQVLRELTERARAGGLRLTGEGGLLGRLTKMVIEGALEGELDDHLGYGQHDPEGRDGGNSRNGYRAKTVITETGPVELSVPRDRDSNFEPKIVAKRQRRPGYCTPAAAATTKRSKNSARPNTWHRSWRDRRRYLMTGSDAASDPGGSWPLPREPLPLETNLPGVFAAGDVRCGSVKRCAAAIGEGSMAVALVHRRLAEAGGD